MNSMRSEATLVVPVIVIRIDDDSQMQCQERSSITGKGSCNHPRRLTRGPDKGTRA
jgi:hypothetical protein